MLEVEKKYRVSLGSPKALKGLMFDEMEQFYLSVDPCVRVRIVRGTAVLTVKQPAPQNDGALCNHEYEYEIPLKDAREMGSRTPYHISKTRYYKPVAGGYLWEIDVFHGLREGLILAEIEFKSGTVTEVPVPDFFASMDDVSTDRAYTNAVLSNPEALLP